MKIIVLNLNSLSYSVKKAAFIDLTHLNKIYDDV